MKDITFCSVAELSRMLSAREISAVELARHYLSRIEAHRGLNAFLDVRPEETLRQAQDADERIAKGTATALTGIPLAHKDIFVTKEWASTAASKMLDGYMSPFDATVVSKLKSEGMVCLGKLNCDEFAMGSGNENSAYGRVYNPWDNNAVPGGSSGGSSSAVAAGLCPIATGTDTGGSIREPASFTGVTGIKPTYGRPSRLGMIAFASSLDTAGLLAHSAEDCAMVLGSMVGFDPRDSTSVNKPTEDFTRHLNDGVKGVRIGVPRKWVGEGVDPELRASIEEALAVYRRLGADIVDIDLPMAELGVPVYYVVACAEASSNLSRFDGVRYGHRAAEYTDIIDMIKKSRNEGFGPEPKRRIMIGTYVLSHGYYDAYYLKAQKVRRLIAREFHETFRNVD
ncbi:MAG: amidase family protein, partial [Sutterella sp.]